MRTMILHRSILILLRVLVNIYQLYLEFKMYRNQLLKKKITKPRYVDLLGKTIWHRLSQIMFELNPVYHYGEALGK